MQLIGSGLIFCRHRLFFWFPSASREFIHNHPERINYRVEARTLIYRKLERYDTVPESGSGLLQCG
ncbi:MAG: hypothetical protein ACKOCH_18360, partial [Bacteroidota bacterium]